MVSATPGSTQPLAKAVSVAFSPSGTAEVTQSRSEFQGSAAKVVERKDKDKGNGEAKGKRSKDKIKGEAGLASGPA